MQSSANQGGSKYGSGSRSKNNDHAAELTKQAASDDLEKGELEKHGFVETFLGHYQLKLLITAFSILGGCILIYLSWKLWKKYIRKIPVVRRFMSRLYYKKGKIVPHVHKHKKMDGVAGEGHGHSHGGGDHGHAHGGGGHGHGHGHGQPKPSHGHNHGEKKAEEHGHGHNHGDKKPEEHGHGHNHGEKKPEEHGHGHNHGEPKVKTEHNHGEVKPNEHGHSSHAKPDIENQIDPNDVRELRVGG